MNDGKASFEQVRAPCVLERDFTPEHDEATPTLKLKRKIVGEHFAPEIEALRTVEVVARTGLARQPGVTEAKPPARF